MEKSVIIVIIISSLTAWISWLVYNYVIFIKRFKNECEIISLKNKITNIKYCLNDFVNTINKKFPNSTLRYVSYEDSDVIEGELKY